MGDHHGLGRDGAEGKDEERGEQCSPQKII